MKPASLSRRRRRGQPPARGFTLVEVMMAAAVGGLILAAVASIIVMSARMVYKDQEISAAATNTRLVQEHINGEMSSAISQTSPVPIIPGFALSSGTTPQRFARMTYRVPIGSFATVINDTDPTSTTIQIRCPSDIVPKAGDYFLMDTPNLGAGILIDQVDSIDTSGGYTITLDTSIHTGSVEPDYTANTHAKPDKLVRIQRLRKYEVADPNPSTSPVTELRWYETAASDSYVVLSKNVDASSRYLFTLIPDPTSAAASDPTVEPAVSWQFSYVSENRGTLGPGGNSDYYQTNYAEGLIMPKSGNPLNTASILGGGSTTTSTTSTTSSTTTTSTSTSFTTTSVPTTTTSTSLTTTSTTTSISTSSTSTTSTTSISTSSTSTTSTTSISTSSTSTTSTSSISTTSTSVSTTTTSVTTTSSTTSTSTSSTTSISTTTTSTTSTSSTSTTSIPTTSTTTSIPFDG